MSGHGGGDHGHGGHGHAHVEHKHSVMDLTDVINTRRSVRKFLEVPVEWDNVLKILHAGRMAPSSGNVQNWRFIIYVDPEKRMKIAEACLSQYWIAQAPLIIIVVGDTNKAQRFYGERGANFYTIQNCAAAIQNMLLTIHDLGLGATWVSAFDEGMIGRVTGVPDNAMVQAVIPIGYPNEKPEHTPRLDPISVVRFEGYDGRIEDFVEVSREYSVYVAKALEKGKVWWKKIKDKIEHAGKKNQP